MTSFEAIASGPLQKYQTLSATIGGDVKKQCDLVVAAFNAQRDLLAQAKNMSQPSDAQFKTLLDPCSIAIQQVSAFKDANRKSEYFNHLSAVGESVLALGWVAVKSSTEKYIAEMIESGKFYSNRVLKEFKDKEPAHAEWVKAVFDVWGDLRSFVSGTYPTGIVWSGTSSGAPPPPPPAPAPMPVSDTPAAAAPTAALFAELNRGEAVTSGLRKVTDNMKTHKNPDLKNQGEAPVVRPKGPPQVPLRPDQRKVVQPPVLELRGHKWCVENHVNNKEVVVNTTEKKETVYIYKCVDSVVQVKGKINSIVMDSCTKTSLLFDSVISAVDVINCKSAAIQVTGSMPTINIDKTDGCMVYLSEESKAAEIITAKSSEMNILIPKGDGDYNEYPIPEQFKTKFNGTRIDTKVNDLS